MTPRSWELSFEGNLVCSGMASWFGGKSDPDDDGSTASGIMNDGSDPNLMGCALPMAISNGQLVKACIGSPFPPLPYKSTMVKITANWITITVPLIDCGPAFDENRCIDLTVAAFKALGGDLDNGLMPVSFIVLTSGHSL
jgi:rare lipoprotein A (peptidoglycan hydrolase)